MNTPLVTVPVSPEEYVCESCANDKCIHTLTSHYKLGINSIAINVYFCIYFNRTRNSNYIFEILKFKD